MFDVRVPLGAMFAIFGGLLVISGLAPPPQAARATISPELGLWWGGVLLTFGVALLALVRWGRRP
jgi:hypothetical protein